MSFSAADRREQPRALAQPFLPKPLCIVLPFPPSGSVELREEDLPGAFIIDDWR
jgi:hypothetical protein